MASPVFLRVHFERDAWRVNLVCNSWITHGEAAGNADSAAFGEVKKGGQTAVHSWIDDNLHGTTAETVQRDYLQYEIQQSLARGNGLLGVQIRDLKNVSRQTDYPGTNPFQSFYVESSGWRQPLKNIVHIYGWINGNGYTNLGSWIETAASKAGR